MSACSAFGEIWRPKLGPMDWTLMWFWVTWNVLAIAVSMLFTCAVLSGWVCTFQLEVPVAMLVLCWTMASVPPPAALTVERGWVLARRTILVSDTVSFLAAALLYYFAIGSVRGFAFTLGLTTVIDVVVVFTFTKPMITLLARTRFYGQGHPLSGLDPRRLGARAPWRGTPRPATRVPARTTPAKEA